MKEVYRSFMYKPTRTHSSVLCKRTTDLPAEHHSQYVAYYFYFLSHSELALSL